MSEIAINEGITMKAKNYIISTVLNTSLFVIMSIVTKAINLAFNVLIARIVSKESYGIAGVYLLFIYMLMQYFPRELMRKTCQKYCPDKNEDIENIKFKEACQLCWLMNFIMLLVSVPLFFTFVTFGGERLSELKVHLVLFIFSAYFELIAEPVIMYMNLKILNANKLVAMSLANYSRVSSNYFFALLFGMDLWSFTLSRLLCALLYTSYLYFIGIFKYHLSYDVLLPDFPKIKHLYINLSTNHELKGILLSFSKITCIKMVLNYTERIVLSFFIVCSASEKADYVFIVDNFYTFIKYFIEPAEENFYNLINKIKQYKGLTVIPSTGEEFEGDFSISDNDELLIKIYSHFKKDKRKDKENYSFKLLKMTLKLFLVFGIMLPCYFFIIGKDLLVFIFTEKWATAHAVSILHVYCIYVSLIAINGIMEAYANATYSYETMKIYNSFLLVTAFLLISLSLSLPRYDITGLVYAGGLALLFKITVNSYLTVMCEFESEKKNDEEKNNNSFSFSSTKYIFFEMLKFIRKSFPRFSAVVATIMCLVILNLIKNITESDDDNKFLLLLSSGLIAMINTLLIFMLEKKGFVEILRLKTIG